MSSLNVKPPPHSRSTSRDSRTYFPTQPEGLVVPDGAVSERAAELLADLSHGHAGGHGDVDMDAAYHERREHAKSLAWWKTPSPWWILGIMPFFAIATSATIAPKIEIYTVLACRTHKPDVYRQTLPTLGGMIGGIQPISEFEPIISPLPNSTVISTMVPTFKETISPNDCASDPTVQAAVAKLIAAIAATTGVLSCLTTGYWGSLSDRYGRTRVMGISILGVLLANVNFIFTAWNLNWVPGGYWFLIVGPVIEGILGGMTTATAASHAYVSDTCTEAERSRILSLSLGLLFAGVAVGPTLGSFLIRATGNVLVVFYTAAAIHVFFSFLIWTTFPEPLLTSQMSESQREYDDEKGEFEKACGRMSRCGRVAARTKRVLGFLSPLSVFVADVVGYEEEEAEVAGQGGGRGRNPLKRERRDWNLLLVALAYGFANTIMGSYEYKFQYAAATFHWGSEQIGYWLSIVGFARGTFLTLILPVILKLVKPKPMTIEIAVDSGSRPSLPSTDEGQPLLNPDSPSHARKTITKEIHSPSFDFWLGRISLFIDALSYTAMAFSFSALTFTLSSILGAFGAGYGPALQSVALAMYMRKGGKETGRLFGALSVVLYYYTCSSQILGPAIYGLIYVKTVGTYPRTIFFVSMISSALSFLCLALIRMPKGGGGSIRLGEGEGEGDVEEGVGEGRG